MEKLRLAILLSGTGRTLANFLEKQRSNGLYATIELVIASRRCPGVDIAINAGLQCVILEEKDFRKRTRKPGNKLCHADQLAYNDTIFSQIDQIGVDYVCCAGWLNKLLFPPHYTNRIINIHPALLPSFGGKGMYGRHVHEAVLEHGCKLAGCTVHFVDDEYDHGPILHQASTYVTDDDTVETLGARVFDLECVIYPMVIRNLALYNPVVSGRKVFFSKK